jgi:hypothetical protein
VSYKISITLFDCIVVFHSIFSIWHGLPLSYLHKKKLRIEEETDVGTYSASMNSKNIVTSVGIFNDSDAIDIILLKNINEKWFLGIVLGWTMILVNSARSITPPKFQNASWNVWIVNNYSYFVLRAHKK